MIGDCVIVAGNLHREQPDHLSRLAKFALKAVQAAADTPVLADAPPVHGYVQIRCG